MHLTRYVMSRFVVFWLSLAILVYGWFEKPLFVQAGFSASETLVRNLTRIDETGKAETLAVHILHVADLLMIGAIMLVVTLVLTAARNLTLGTGEHRMTLPKAIAHVVVLLVLAYAVLAMVWWHDARLVNAWFDASQALVGQVAAAIDPRGRLDLVLRTLGVARHLIVGCLMLALALVWETLKWAARGGRALVRHNARNV